MTSTTDHTTLDHACEAAGVTAARLPCSRCGMIANVDPWLHEKRYGHKPTVTVAGVVFRHDGTGVFRPSP